MLQFQKKRVFVRYLKTIYHKYNITAFVFAIYCETSRKLRCKIAPPGENINTIK